VADGLQADGLQTRVADGLQGRIARDGLQDGLQRVWRTDCRIAEDCRRQLRRELRHDAPMRNVYASRAYINTRVTSHESVL
jgi:hypothetical protein